jgi:hypothetical protein
MHKVTLRVHDATAPPVPARPARPKAAPAAFHDPECGLAAQLIRTESN